MENLLYCFFSFGLIFILIIGILIFKGLVAIVRENMNITVVIVETDLTMIQGEKNQQNDNLVKN